MYLDSPVFVSTKVLRLLCLKMKVDELLLNLDNNRVSGVLLVNYCKAFDMVDHNLGSGNYQDLDKTQVKLFPDFTSIPFDCLLISWVTGVSNLGFLTCLSWIVSIENSTLSNVQTLNLAYKVQNFSDFFGKIPVRILLDALLLFRFSKASFCALTSSFTAF